MAKWTSTQTDDGLQSTGLGSFAGVFTPSILTILGIILFMRLGYVIGNAGFGRALIIIGMANAISVLTSISLAAIATNLKVKSGGDYYLISRTLGVEFGGALGLVLFLAQSISVAFYCLGFGELTVSFIGSEHIYLPQIVAALAITALFVLAWMGADVATKFQFVVMAALVAALVSFFMGGIPQWSTSILMENWSAPRDGPGFWVLFAIFFPAVTGFTQGVSMSGDLKNPTRSLPLGTFAAVGLSILVYLGVAAVFSATMPNSDMAGDYRIMNRVAAMPFLIDVGVIAATLSSAMASFMGAPRILQSLSKDRTFSFLSPFALGTGPNANPRRATLLTAVIAFATVAMGNLNLIAPVVTMFFLVSYGLLNYATYFEAKAASPSFRPTFKWFDHRLSLLGSLACLGVMLAIDVMAGLSAVALLAVVYQYLRLKSGPARWADSRRSHYLQSARTNLMAAWHTIEHPRDWRPQILAFSDDPERRQRLLRFASWLEGGSGMTTMVQLLEGEGAATVRKARLIEEELRRDIKDTKAFPLVIHGVYIPEAISSLVQSYGVGPIKANTMLLNWQPSTSNDNSEVGISHLQRLRYGKELAVGFRAGCNLIVLDVEDDRLFENPINGVHRRIDVWWRGDATSRLMLLLAYLMTRSDEWSEANIRVLAVDAEQEPGGIESVMAFLDEVRIKAVVKAMDGVSSTVVIETSRQSDLVFVPFRLKDNEMVDHIDEPLDKTLAGLSVAMAVLAAVDIELAAEPEEGLAGQLAAALDAMDMAGKRAVLTQKRLESARDKVRQRMQDLTEAMAEDADDALIERARIALDEARLEAGQAVKKVARDKAKLEDAAREAERLGADVDED